MFPSWSSAALPIQRWRPSFGAYVLCWLMKGELVGLRISYQRTAARELPASTVWLNTIVS